MNFKTTAFGVLALVVLVATPAMAGGKILGADEVKALITDKTVTVTRKKDGKKWKMFFGADGNAFETAGKPTGKWKIDADGKQCSLWLKSACASISDLGNGTYARLNKKGKTLVTWTKFVDGKKF